MPCARLTKILVVIAALSSLNASAEAAKEEVAPAAEKVPLVTVEVQRSSKEISDRFTMKFTIANTTDAPIAVKGLRAIVPAERVRKAEGANSSTQWAELTFDSLRLNAGQKVVKRIDVPSAPAYNSMILFFAASNLETGATIFYSVEDLHQPVREVEATIPLEWGGNILGKLLGGLIGCSALALFLSSREVSGARLSRARLLAFVSSFFSTVAVGLGTVLAGTLLVAFLAPGSLPISFAVEDWRGGALLGLFSIPVGGWLLDKLSAKKLADEEKKTKEEQNG
jgi:hypothetical protein